MAENLSAPMNDDNVIDTQSLLFGFLAEYAQQNRFSVSLNRLIKQEGDNAMCIPMNIRPDDIYFTVAGLKEAKLNGVALSAEYVEGVMEQLDFKSPEVEACGFCDTIIVKDKKLYGELATGKAICAVLKEAKVSKLAILGSGKLAKSIVMHIQDTDIKELVLLNDRIESCMTLQQAHSKELEGITVDIDRCIENQEIDVSSFDGFINATPAAPKLSKINKDTVLIDLKRESNLVDYAAVFSANFIDNEKYSKVLSKVCYEIWKRG
ncbi:hypothetical protein JHD50_03290 [Sulfurimonas sp. MAG313]|nr:hypothetical protein [Sulfurimonas sp. MAG313]MDF1880337.1 hypothetical protein [Sulfurimonas sp. MAG313]